MKYACIAAQHRDFDIALMCRCLGVSRAGFYAAQRRGPSRRAEADVRLTLAIRVAHRRSRRRYGAPKVHHELCAAGLRCGRKRVARLMRADGLRGCVRRTFHRTTRTDPQHPVRPNHLARQFAPTAHAGCNCAWVADITYLATSEGWLYLAVVLDLASRRVVGWAADRQMETALPLRALAMALRTRRPRPGLLHHSDRGAQYTSAAYQAQLAAVGAVSSMSGKGECWDNAVAESFFSTLKRELVHHERYASHAEARRSLFEYIEVFYNRRRRHSTLGYRSPADFEARFA